ncbi:hypothetical protein CLG85_006720 [Yangia mangrovi]|uniref:Lipoprotein n=1 Tax=Alloyangia mangrovi TaxID=1779329 RepID=A0A2A3JRC5_9RHOB|nr:hypothetical protein [Alloyangia mangrovi]MCT4370040.1 hypothetical protein [Alloyangia mangrovi]
MGQKGIGYGSSALAALVLLLTMVSGCGGEELQVPAEQVVSSAPVDPSLYAGTFALALSETIETPGNALPFRAYLGLAPQSGTRLGVRAAVDLRDIQRVLPVLVSGSFDPDCGLGLAVGLTSAQAEGDAVRARGTVRAELYRCKGGETESAARGAHLWSQMVDFDTLVGAGLTGECVGFELRDLALDPRGFIGGLGTLFGITEKVRLAILEQGNEALRAAPVCPEMPDALALLSPDFSSGGAVEIGEGGIGAALEGTVTTDAARLVGLLGLWQRKGALPGAGEDLTDLPEAAVSFRFENALKDFDPPVPYRVDIAMTPNTPTRIGVGLELDLRALQMRLPEIAKGALLVDDCRSRVEVQAIDTLAQGATLVAHARLEARSYTCERTGDSAWQRGELERSEEVDVRAEVSASVAGNCAVFHLVDLARDPPLPVISKGRQGARSEAARTLFIDAVDALLKTRPLCPELPAEFGVLDPQFRSGGPREMGSGGLGFRLEGSVDLSTTTIIALLQMMQERGFLPPRP